MLTSVWLTVVVCILAADAVLAIYLVRLEERRHVQELNRLDARYAAERAYLLTRVEYLEFQLASHVAHLLKLPPPVPPARPPELTPLPEVMRAFLDAIDDEESRAEYEADFRAQMELPDADPHAIVAKALSG